MHFNTNMVTVCVISVHTHQHVDLKLWINAMLYFTIYTWNISILLQLLQKPGHLITLFYFADKIDKENSLSWRGQTVHTCEQVYACDASRWAHTGGTNSPKDTLSLIYSEYFEVSIHHLPFKLKYDGDKMENQSLSVHVIVLDWFIRETKFLTFHSLFLTLTSLVFILLISILIQKAFSKSINL